MDEDRMGTRRGPDSEFADSCVVGDGHPLWTRLKRSFERNLRVSPAHWFRFFQEVAYIFRLVEIPSGIRDSLNSVACLYIDRCLVRLEKEKPEDLLGDRVASIVSSAERTLPVFWGVDPEVLTKATREKVDAYPAKIRGWFDKIDEQKSWGLLKEVVKARSDLATWRGENKQNAEMKWQDYIDRTNAASTKLQRLIASMSSIHHPAPGRGGRRGKVRYLFAAVSRAFSCFSQNATAKVFFSSCDAVNCSRIHHPRYSAGTRDRSSCANPGSALS